MKKNISIYEFLIDDNEESGVKCVSIVPDPAFQSKAVLFSKTKLRFIELQDSNPKKRRIGGLALIPDVLIYRRDEFTGEEYFGFFSKETIEKIVEKFHAELNNNNVNLNHNENQVIDAILVEDFIVDSEARVEDLKSKGITHENIMGAWYVSYKINDEKTFNSIMENQKAGNPTGFSIEIFADRYLVKMNKQINNNKLKTEMKKNNKNLLEKIVSIFKSEDLERALVPELGFQIEWTEIGQPVQQVAVDEEGNEVLTPIGAGEFITEEGIVVVDDQSNLVEIRELPEEIEEPVEETPIEEVPMQAETSEDSNLSLEDEEISLEKKEEVVNEPSKEETLSKELELQKQNFSTLQSKFEEIQKENDQLKKENDELKAKMKEPITDPVLDVQKEAKDWSKMSAYEKAIYKARK